MSLRVFESPKTNPRPELKARTGGRAHDSVRLLRQNHDTFFSLIQNAPFGVYVIDAQFRLKQVSVAAEPVFAGIEPLIGRDFEEILRLVWDEPFASEALGRFRHTLATGEPYSAPITTEQRHNTANVESYDWKIERITLPDGQFGVVCYFYDITERKRVEYALRASEAFSQSILQSSPDCIKVLDLSGTLLSMPSGQALLGITDIAPFLNKSWIDFWQGEHRALAQAAVRRAAAGGTGQFIGFFISLSGVPKWWDVLISPILDADGQPAQLLAVSRDITVRKHAEINLAFLASVSRDLLVSTSVSGMMATVGARLGAQLQLSICAFAEIDESAEQVVINHDWHHPDALALVGTYKLGEFVEGECIRLARAGEAIVVRNTADDSRTDPLKFAKLNIASFICAPLIDAGQWRFALCLYHRDSYDWRDDEIELARELTARIWTRLQSLRAEQALIESEERYRSLFASAPTAIFVCDQNGFIQHYNPVAAQMWGREPVRGTERHSGSLKLWNVDGTPLLHDQNPVVEVLRTGIAALHVELVIERPDGTRLPVLLNVAAIKNVDGKITGSISSFVDISRRHQAEEALRRSEERFRALFDWGPLALYTVDATGQLEKFNRRAVELWGRKPRRGANGAWDGSIQFYRPDATPLTPAQTPVALVLSGALPVAHDVELEMERADGTRISVIANVHPLKNSQGLIVGAMNGLYDVTERSQFIKKLAEQTRELLEMDRRKDEFLAMLGHELRNPLTPIANATCMLRMQVNEDALQRQARVVIERQVGQMQHLVDDLLEVSRINSGRVRLRLQPTDVSDVMTRAAEAMGPLMVEFRHAFTLALPAQPIYVNVDAARLEQVLVNLLSNAIKYTDPGGTLALTAEPDGSDVVLRVIDNGIGMAPELIPQVFELFTQADRSLDRSQGGLGIGLCLVQRLVEMHGGLVSVHSVLGEGSEFAVRLPIFEVPGLTAGSTALMAGANQTDSAASSSVQVQLQTPINVAPESAFKQDFLETQAGPIESATVSRSPEFCRVMVVDDNVDAAQTVAMLLEMSGCQVQVAHSGEGVFDAALSWSPHVMLLDIGLPGMNGLEVAKRVRQAPMLNNTVLVALTGYGLEADRKRSQDAGFDHHLVKPVGFDEIEKIIEQACIKKRLDCDPALTR